MDQIRKLWEELFKDMLIVYYQDIELMLMVKIMILSNWEILGDKLNGKETLMIRIKFGIQLIQPLNRELDGL